MNNTIFYSFLKAIENKTKQLAILIDPDKFKGENIISFLNKIPKDTTHLFVGGSTANHVETEDAISMIKKHSNLPIVIFPGDVSQINNKADALLFLTLLSGRNPEYLIGQHIKAIPLLKEGSLEVISTGYLLIEGGNTSSIARVSNTSPISQNNITTIVHTAKASELLGHKLIYLEAGSGAKYPVHSNIIKEVKKEIKIPIIVGGGIKTEEQKNNAYQAGADMVVMGTVFENNE